MLWWTIHFFNYQIALELFRQGDDDEDGIARNHMFPRTKCLSQRQCEEPGLCDGCGFYFVWRSCGSHCQHCAGLISKTKFPTSSPRRAWCGIKKVLRDSILTSVTYMKRHLYEASQQPFQCKLQAWFFRRFVQVTLPRMESQETLRFFLLLGGCKELRSQESRDRELEEPKERGMKRVGKCRVKNVKKYRGQGSKELQ